MAGHEWKDWFEREELIGQISDLRVQNLQVEREVVQKRTFTRWMNLHLEKCDPPMEVHDLFRDIQDGRILMALLEELSGCKLLHGFKKSSHRIFRLNNIAKVLSFLEERNVKLVSIDAADVADGNSSIVLGLIWNIILFFQIKELTGNIHSQFPSSSSLSSIPTSSDSDTSHSSTPSDERRTPRAAAARDHGRAIKKLLQWVQKRTRKYGVAAQDFGKSWTSGLAFLAVIKSIDPSLVDMRRALLRSARENLEEAFRTAHYSLGIPRLLEPEDVTINPPDEQSIMTYVSQFLKHFPDMEEPEEPSQVIERSVSMGRLSSWDAESEQIRNGLHRSRLRERPHGARTEVTRQPPRIFISSVSEDRGLMSPTSPSPVGSRSWASEDSLAGSKPPAVAVAAAAERSAAVGGEARATEVFAVSTSDSPQPPYVHSPVDSSPICDSAIGSPDSWLESRLGESRSDDSSLCDSGTAWEVSVTPEGLMPSLADKPPDDQTMPELFVDEGVYSMTSVETTLGRPRALLETNQDDEERRKKKEVEEDLGQEWANENVPGQKEAEGETERESENASQSPLQKGVKSHEQSPSLELFEGKGQAFSGDMCSLEPQPSQPGLDPNLLTSGLFGELTEKDGVQSSTRGDEGRPEESAEGRGKSPLTEGQSRGETASAGEKTSSEAFQRQASVSKDQAEMRTLTKIPEEVLENPQMEDDANEGVSNGQTHRRGEEIQNDVENSHPEFSMSVDRSSMIQDEELEPHVPLSTDLNNYQISMPSDASRQEKDCAHGQVNDSRAGDEDLRPMRPLESRTVGLEGSPCLLGGPQAGNPPVHLDQDLEKQSSPLSLHEFAITEENANSNSLDLRAGTEGLSDNKTVTEGEGRDIGSTHMDSLEPMDLFYPDKEEAMSPELPKRVDEVLPTVFSMSALQPAPVSETPPESLGLQEEMEGHNPPPLPGEAYWGDDKNEGKFPLEELVEKTAEPPRGEGVAWERGPPRETAAAGGPGAEQQVGPEEPGHPSGAAGERRTSAAGEENMKPARVDVEPSGRPEETLIPAVLRHRKVSGSATDNQRKVPTIKINGDSDLGQREGSLLDSDLYLLLALLWLLLYCLWLLPQMDLRALPGLLFNLDH